MSRIAVILHKEWLELRQERGLLLGTLLPPLLLTLLPIGVTYLIGQVPDEDTNELGMVLADPALRGLGALELGQAVMGKQFALLLLIMPLLIPSIIASYSIVGEKTRRTLEPLLATPTRTWELLLGKALAAFIPAVGLTWLCGAIFIVALRFVTLSPQVYSAIIGPAWLLLLLLCSPLMSLIAIAATVAISARANDPRTAQQLSAVVIVPIMAAFFAQLLGVLVISPAVVLGLAAVLALLAALAVWLAVRLFQREVILTRWT